VASPDFWPFGQPLSDSRLTQTTLPLMLALFAQHYITRRILADQ
jgi:hypothetical protein